jgi:hypothetical protein
VVLPKVHRVRVATGITCTGVFCKDIQLLSLTLQAEKPVRLIVNVFTLQSLTLL